MKDPIRKFSLLLNIFLIAVLSVAIVGIWRVRQTNTQHWQEKRVLQKKTANYKEFINASILASKYQGKSFPKFKIQDIWGDIVTTDFSESGGGIVLLFSPQSCQPCLNTQLKILEHIYQNQDKTSRLPILALANSSVSQIKQYVRSFDLHYKLISYENDELFKNNELLTQKTPAIFLINRDNIITHCHIPSQNRPQFSALFYNEIQRHLNLAQPLFQSHLKGLTFSEVVSNEFDAEPIAQYLY
ncbi:MAG: redoxin domain-containing protein [Candidatus Poribacteria bacterium]|nr:redoxin domain-containing protein [Candidatus Poribacteria bacterium]